MEDISNLPEIPQSNDDVHEAVPEKAADWLLQHQNISTQGTDGSQNQGPLTYELDISPGNKATVKFEDTPELDFDRRHEILDESQPQQALANGMVPLAQILENHPSNHQSAQIPTQQKSAPDFVQPKTVGASSTPSIYRKALFRGFITGVMVTILLVFWLKATGR